MEPFTPQTFEDKWFVVMETKRTDVFLIRYLIQYPVQVCNSHSIISHGNLLLTGIINPV